MYSNVETWCHMALIKCLMLVVSSSLCNIDCDKINKDIASAQVEQFSFSKLW